MDLALNKVTQLLLGKDIGQYCPQLFGIGVKEKPVSRNVSDEVDDDITNISEDEDFRKQYPICSRPECGKSCRSPNLLMEKYIERIKLAASTTTYDEAYLLSIKNSIDDRPTSTDIDDYLKKPVYVFLPHLGLPKGMIDH